MRILIVDDNEDICTLACRLLESHGECEYALSGHDAIYKVIDHWENGIPFDLIFMDIMMPDKNGIETLRDIRLLEEEGANNGYAATKVIMLTASDNAKHVIESFREQSDGYVTKPFDGEKLVKEMIKIGLL